jgi:hypothetical protein
MFQVRCIAFSCIDNRTRSRTNFDPLFFPLSLPRGKNFRSQYPSHSLVKAASWPAFAHLEPGNGILTLLSSCVACFAIADLLLVED